MSSPKITMPGKAVVVNQPNPGVEMDAMKANKTSSCQHEESHKAHRIRGGGAAKDCFLGMLGCFLCFVLRGMLRLRCRHYLLPL
ncbi:hypothetical protein L208DRAFT_672458 [Tricholoma matsutake]|nr:hypothetical protein L208DRAFT_672458 [Tricholoma matsutake 945]